MTSSSIAPKVGVFGLSALFLVLLGACAEQRQAVDRVQPFALDKTFFVGSDLTDPEDNPEFWTQGTLIDVGFGAAQDGLFTSTYAQPMSRMRWQITESLLLGRLSYERIEGTDGKGAGQATNDGIIVVAFPIEKHFDIVRSYNPTTGEKLNVIEENSSDRPWYEREYMRVDWSRNLNTDSYDFDTLSMLGVYGGITYEPLAYDVTDPADPDAPLFDLEEGYFDVTNKAFARPQQVDMSHLGWGIDSFPACFLPTEFSGGTGPVGSCNPVELTIRHSFRRVEDHDYEPVDWDGMRFQAYGGFTIERYGYARNYGMSDDMWHRFLARYQIWERSHYYDDPDNMTGEVECFVPSTTPYGADPHRDLDGNGTEDECEMVGRGSRCDSFRQRCTLPYVDRTTRSVAWYYTNSGYLDFFEPTKKAAHEWDVALRVAARTAQYAECTNLGRTDCSSAFPMYFGQQDENQDAIHLAWEVDLCRNTLAYQGQDCDVLAAQIAQARGYSDGVLSISRMPEMIVLCHSPVEAADPAACGGPRLPEFLSAQACHEALQAQDESITVPCQQALTVRQGDLRYHQVNVHDKPQSPSPWGIYTDAEDPLTGETISASINTWAHVNDLVSQSVIDKLRFIKGELTASDVTEAQHVHNWAQAAEALGDGGAVPRLTREQLEQRIDDYSGRVREDHEHFHAHEHLPANVVQQAHQLKSQLRGVAANLRAPSTHSATYSARRNAAAGTQFEASLMTPMMQAFSGVVGFPLNEGLMKLASPLRGGNPALERDLYHRRQVALAERGACVLHPWEAAAPVSLAGLADVLEDKFGAFNPNEPRSVQLERAERMRRFLSRRAQYAVIAHEMGHSVGLRHNFVSSSDAWSYRPQYWQLRTSNGQVTTPCTDLSPDGEDCVGPRYFDPVTREERANLVWMFMHSTVMDYPGDFTQDLIGLGVYDFAAARMFYGDMAAVAAEPGYGAGSSQGKALLDKMDNFGGILGIRPTRYDPSQGAMVDYHYSQLNAEQDLISDCQVVADPALYKPAGWDNERDGYWSPLLDGMMVRVDGNWTRCRQQKVDFVPWSSLRMPSAAETGGFYMGGPAVDGQGRIRMPYGFATDSWADLGNLSVYRHDNGADPYEIFNFFISQQEIGHIFDAYRRGRQGFSVRKAANRILHRYNTKLRDGAKGLGLMKNVYDEFALELGYDSATLWPIISGDLFRDNILASGLAFDHFARLLARPEAGDHYLPPGEQVYRSVSDTVGAPDEGELTIPNGASGRYEQVSYGGKLVENRLAENQGEYDRDYTLNAGSYYEKASAAMLLTESVDNFISDSRKDFVDPRYRAVSMADLFPDGFRRLLANNLTGDDDLKGPRVAANLFGTPLLDGNGYPGMLGWVSWWGDSPTVCFPAAGTTACASYAGTDAPDLSPGAPAGTVRIDPQVGWEQQKFLIAWTMLYLPENEQRNWLEMLQLWELGRDADPEFNNRLEFHYPDGRVYIAKTFGREEIFGRTVQRGVAARVLEYANSLLFQAYETTPGPDLDGDGQPDWYVPVVDPGSGRVRVLFDSSVDHLDENGMYLPGGGRDGCNDTDNSECGCSSNRACLKLESYLSVPAYLREALDAYQLGDPDQRGVY